MYRKIIFPSIKTSLKLSNLDNKTAIVTGGATGLGKKMAEHFASNNVNTIICSRNLERLEKTTDEINKQLHEIIDIKLLDQMLKHNAVDDKYIFSLINFIITQLKDFDSIDNEPIYEKWRNLINIHLSSNTLLYIIIPRFLRETFFYIDEIENNI